MYKMHYPFCTGVAVGAIGTSIALITIHAWKYLYKMHKGGDATVSGDVFMYHHAPILAL